jgi:VTC domain-containing protein
VTFQHKLQGSRFELKYVIDEGRARAVRDYMRSYVEPDEHASLNDCPSYGVHSLYVDSPGYTLCQQTVRGLKNRFKLRIRYYDDDPASPVFLEIKSRVDQAILKERAGITREGAQRVLDGGAPGPEHILRPSDESSCRRFCELRDRLNGSGKVYVSYHREAYVSPNSNKLRVTFDRNIIGRAYDRGTGLDAEGLWSRPRIDGVVLEIKFTNRFPEWMRDMVSVFDLDRSSMAKYVRCVEAVRSQHGMVATTVEGLTL